MFTRLVMVSTQQRTDDDSSQPVKASLKSYGITEPLSIAGPSAADVKRNLELEKVSVVFVCFFVPMKNCFQEQCDIDLRFG